jgi:4-hydroxy-tetrahydrodipicolinate synthase
MNARISARGPLQGVLAAALTPLRNGGDALDQSTIPHLVDFYAEARLDGVMVAGTTGEGLLLSRPERELLSARFLEAGNGRLPVTVHAGCMSTADTVALAVDAAEKGAVAVAVCAPPFFALDEVSLLAHFQAAADACNPLPFYLYEIQPRAGYAIPVAVVERLRDTAENLVGMKVSDSTFEELERYLLPGLDILVGAESLLTAGLTAGAVGAISGVAGALPHHVVHGLRDPGDRGSSVGPLRAGLERYPFHAAAKLALVAQNLALEACVRAPLRQLTPAERTGLEDWLAGVLVSRTEVVAP